MLDPRRSSQGPTGSTEQRALVRGPLPHVSMPKGGGAIRGIGETFAATPATGTSSLTVPIALSPGRNGFGPRLSLSYDSGSGNGPFGMGWSIGVPTITRATDKRLPRYLDDDESDEFVLSGSETLVRVLDTQDERTARSVTLHGVDYEVAGYRPRTEGLFARIERWTDLGTGTAFWRSISRENVTSVFGLDPGSRLVDPLDDRRIFSWLLCRSFDDKGNLTVYDHVAENDDGVDVDAVHEASRDRTVVPAQRYLKRIRYAASTPWFPDWSEGGAQAPLPDLWHHELVLDYGDHDGQRPTPAADRAWAVRPDPFSSYRAGFEVRTYRRCERVLLFHHFPGKPGVDTDCLVRSTDLTYSDEVTPTDPRNPIYTLLSSVAQAGYRRVGAGYRRRAAPPLEFAYSSPVIHTDVMSLDAGSLEGLPEGLDGTRAQLVDLEGDGLSGILNSP